jgi:hypothetical protein
MAVPNVPPLLTTMFVGALVAFVAAELPGLDIWLVIAELFPPVMYCCCFFFILVAVFYWLLVVLLV